MPMGLAISAGFVIRGSKPSATTIPIVRLNSGYHSLFNRNNLNVGTSLLLRKGGETQIRLHYPDVGEDLLGVLSLEARVDNNIVAYYEVRKC